MIQSIENGRKEDGNRSIADKIIKRLHDLDKTVENNQGRWAWELLQNAKDSVADDDRAVSVQIQLDDDNVEFRHTGTHFTEQDVRGLINQISSKEIEEGQQTKKVGRFGTGFLTTHLLSKIIEIKGIVKTERDGFYSFQFPLDREGKTTLQLMPKIESAWSSFHTSASKISDSFDKEAFNTVFAYKLKTDGQKEIARIGVEEFIQLLPFVFAFIPKIGKIEIINNVSGRRTVFDNIQERMDDGLIIPIEKTENGVKSKIYILHSCNDRVAIAAELKKTAEGYTIKDHKDIPKLFCDFPLIGTENFHFPVIVNSFFFHPQTERDGIWLKGKKDEDDPEVTENQELLISAVDLFTDLLPEISGKYFDLYNVSETKLPNTNEKYFDEDWYKENIQTPLRELILDTDLIELEDGSKKAPKDLWFPLKSYSKSIQEKIWQFTYDLFPHLVCKKSHMPQWSDLSWESWKKLHYGGLAKDIEAEETIDKLSETLEMNRTDTYRWLNSVCTFILEDEANTSLFEKHSITPNQNGTFERQSELYIDEINDSDLVSVLHLLEEDWKEILLHKQIVYGRYLKKEKKDIALKISEKLKNPGSDDSTIKAICILSEWFENNDPDQSKGLFSELYRKKADLFMNTIKDKESLYKVMRSSTDLSKLAIVAQALDENPRIALSSEDVKQLSDLLNEFKVNSISELKEAIEIGERRPTGFHKIEIDQNVLVSLGVTTMQELEEALKDKNLASLFHTSTPNATLFLYVQTLIARAKRNIISHLETLPNYDCSEREELATTVLGGIKKDGLSIHIVIRPSDSGEVIVYYSSEKDTLDYENAELWIENGKDKPRLLTLGKILKNTGVNKIPV